jgi:hypothetical protein
MAGLDPAIHALAAKKDVDARVKPGHDEFVEPPALFPHSGSTPRAGVALLVPSLRGANGSRECAPDDRLRDEAIQLSAYAARWIASLRSQ